MSASAISVRCEVWGYEARKRITKGVENVSPQSQEGLSTSSLYLHYPGMFELLDVVG